MADDSFNEVPFEQLLPDPIKRRVQALKKLQLQGLNLEAEFFRDVYKLEYQYHTRFSDLYNNRMKIVNGDLEPSDEDCKLGLSGSCEDNEPEEAEVIKDFRAKLSIVKIDKGRPGIPDFWLTIFKNVQLLNDMIQPHDEPILRHLSDIKLLICEEPMGFILKFFFSTNPYFTDLCLTKKYEMRCSPDENDPWSFEGPEIYKCKGCKIEWNKNMNVTVKTIRKRQRHKSRGAVRTILRTVQDDSFFNFFNPPQVPENGEVDDETQALLTSDFEIGHYIREKIIPHAVLYFTGEALDDEYFDSNSSMGDGSESDELGAENVEEEEEEEEEDDDDDDDEDGDDLEEIVDSGNVNRVEGNREGSKNSVSKKKKKQPQECAQQ